MEGLCNSSQLIDLPEDILIECFVALDAQDLLKCAQVCTRFRTLIDADIRLQYAIELYANNMVHNPRFGRYEPIALRLERLTKYRSRLRNHRLKRIESFALSTTLPPQEGRGLSDAVDGILIAWIVFGSFVRFTQIPSPTLGIRCSQYDLHIVDGSVVQLTCDPAQDLVVAVESAHVGSWIRPFVSVRSLLTGEKHSMAKNLVCWIGDSDIPLNALLIAVYGDHVALSVRRVVDRVTNVIVCNWKTNNTILNIGRAYMFHGYEWLSERYLLLVETHNNSTGVSLTVIDVLDPDDPIICTLDLPRMPESALANEFPIWVRIKTHPSSQGILSQRDVPFLPSIDLENKLVVISFYNHVVGGFIVCSLASDLLKVAQENRRKGSNPVIAWEDWSATRTRLISMRNGGWHCVSVFGTRALVQDLEDIELYDFNQKLIRQDLAKRARKDERLMINPTVVQNERLFMNKVETCLPFRITYINKPKGVNYGRNCELSVDSVFFVPRLGSGEWNVDIYSF